MRPVHPAVDVVANMVKVPEMTAEMEPTGGCRTGHTQDHGTKNQQQQ
jgi:hypothetical protein